MQNKNRNVQIVAMQKQKKEATCVTSSFHFLCFFRQITFAWAYQSGLKSISELLLG
jgi:hypothetical protein